MSQLRDFNRALTQLTQQSRELEPSRVEAKSYECPNFSNLQRLAKNLFDTLKLGLRCASGCQGHAIKLRLESRGSGAARVDKTCESTPYRVIFVRSSDLQWKEADVRCLADTSQNIAFTAVAPKPTVPNPARKQVRFTQLDRQSQRSQSGPSVTVTVVQRQSRTISTTEPERLQTLCETIQRLSQPQTDSCVGYLLDSANEKHGVFLANASPDKPQDKWKAYTLRDLLTGKATNGARLTQYDKLRIAVDLASSVLQLHQTPWLDESLGLENVYFVQQPRLPPPMIYEHPFVSRDISITLPSSAANTQRPTSRVIRNQTLFALGVLLIELWYGEPIEDLRTTPDEDWQGTPSIAWCTAERIVENELEFEAGKRYSDAVRRCIRCDFDRKVNDLENKGFQQAVFNGVVVPLQTTLQDFRGQGSSS